MNRQTDILWALGSLCELVLKQNIFVEMRCNVLLERKDTEFLTQQIKRKAEYYDLRVDVLYLQPLLEVRIFPNENEEEFHNENDFVFCSRE